MDIAKYLKNLHRFTYCSVFCFLPLVFCLLSSGCKVPKPCTPKKRSRKNDTSYSKSLGPKMGEYAKFLLSSDASNFDLWLLGTVSYFPILGLREFEYGSIESPTFFLWGTGYLATRRQKAEGSRQKAEG